MMPDFIAPMLATLINQPFDDDDWLFEVKWDGYRALAFIKRGDVNLKSRNNLSLNAKFPSLIEHFKKSKGEVILDGEIVVLNDEGKPQFQWMQNYQKERKGTLCYYIFDILYQDGQDLRSKPLIERKEILKKYLDDLSVPSIRYSAHIIKNGISFFKEVSKMHLEGIIGKNIASSYQSRRSHDWVKIKTSLSQEVVIGGFTEPRGSRKKFGALLVGVFNDQKEFIYVGHVGGGFNHQSLEQLYQLFIPLIEKKCPFKNIPASNTPVTWIKPILVCEVSFAEWTADHIMRQPIFHGLREDKAPKAIRKESAILPPIDSTKKMNKKKKTKSFLTHLDKIYWPEEKYTKGDLIHYYETIAPYLLPYLKNRPIMLHRYPEGIEGNQFYQKDLEHHPDWIKTYPIEQQGKMIEYLQIDDLSSLLYAINLGSIDLHPFLSRYQKLLHPDYCVIDLDPQEISFDKVIEVAVVIHEILDEIKTPHYCKTSGGKGLHLLIPLHGKYSYEQSRQFAEMISLCVEKCLPKTTSLERSPEKRRKKIYLDCLQNRKGQTLVPPYCVRPRPHALVSTPITWEELKKINPSEFNIKSVPERLKRMGDFFKPTLGAGINIKSAIENLSKLGKYIS